MTEVQAFTRALDQDAAPALKRLPAIAQQLQASLTSANRLFGSLTSGYGDDSRFRRDLDRLLPQLTETVRSIRALTDLLSRHPEALIRGRTNTGKE
jgi:paraquat-inducible protein B